MRIAAIYIPENTFPHLFGENHTEFTLNLGGKFNYLFKSKNSKIEVNKVTENENFINEFWGNDISLVSCIVGKNAVGKTTILRSLNNSIDSSSKKLIYLIEKSNSDSFDIINETEKTVIINFVASFNEIKHKSFEPLYYSPTLDYDLVDTFSPISLINYFDNNLEDYYLDSVNRNVNFLNDSIIKKIKDAYYDFPSYDYIKINVKKLRKSRIRAPYLESNFGNPHRGDALKNELKGEISRLKDKQNFYSEFSIEDMIKSHEKSISLLESESFTEQFDKLWNLKDYKYSDNTGYDYIHNSFDFIKNLEVNILSYLLLGATFPQTGLGGGIDFSRINETNNFYDRLNFFLEMYFVNEYKSLTEKIKTDLKGIKIEDSQKIIAQIEKDSFSKLSGVDMNPIKERMISYTESFEAILTFYQKITKIIDSDFVKLIDGDLIFSIQDYQSKLLFDELIYNYKYILKIFPKSPIYISLFDFSPNKKLSTGEKALLDFYSSLYNYIDTNKESKHLNNEYYLLLLDEPDLGFHPLWKKKFINAISKTLPLIFSKINPQKYDEEKKKYIYTRENPVIQIIFSTHDPLTLSDIPNQCIFYLDKNGNSSFIVDSKRRSQKSFGANITDLLADSFFVNDGLIGDFAKEKINATIEWINKQRILKENLKTKYIVDNGQYEFHKKIISIIDEHVLKLKLAEMLEELKGDKNIQEELIDKEIEYLQNKKRML